MNQFNCIVGESLFKNTLIVFVSMLIVIAVGTLGLYLGVATVSGQDSLCISGMFAGLLVGLWLGKVKGLSFHIPMIINSLMFSLPLAIISILIAHNNQDIVVSLAPFGIGFSLLFFYLIGVSWGKHLTSW